MKGKKVVKPKGTRRPRSPLGLVNPDAAGIDCGLAEHYVAVPPGRDPEPVRRFRTFTEDLHGLAGWLVSCGIKTVAMEATGVFWIPVYEILEARGLQVLLVNARHVKNVPGRKSDVADCEWLRQLHSVGLLRGSFRPTADITALRSYLRHRESLVQTASTAVQRMQKALVQMNLQLQVVITDISGTTGLRIIRDIIAGQTDPRQLAKHRNARCNSSEGEIAAALTGNYRPEHVFVLQQNLEIFDTLQRQIEFCDKQVEAHLQQLTAKSASASKPIPAARPRGRWRGEPRFDLRTPLYQLTGADLSQIDGIGPYNAVRLVSEIGTDMSRWATERHFTSWLTLAPNNKISGGRLLSSRTPHSTNRAAAILRMAAMCLSRTDTALGAFYRRLAGRIGKAKAITATARKLARLVYRCLKGEIVYKDPGAASYDRQHRESVLRRLRHRAGALGFTLVNQQTGEILQGVS